MLPSLEGGERGSGRNALCGADVLGITSDSGASLWPMIASVGVESRLAILGDGSGP